MQQYNAICNVFHNLLRLSAPVTLFLSYGLLLYGGVTLASTLIGYSVKRSRTIASC